MPTTRRWLTAALLALAVAGCGQGAGTAATQPTRPATQAAFAAVGDFQLIDAQHGWVRDGDQTLATSDSGQTWTTISVPGSIAGVAFFDASRGVVATNEVDPSDKVDRSRLWLTTDGGSHYAEVAAPGLLRQPITALHADIGGSRLRLLVQYRSGSSFSLATLLTSLDGTTWTASAAPGAGVVHFVDDRFGVIAGGASGREVWSTSDGGSTWQLLAVPGLPAAPMGYAPVVANEVAQAVVVSAMSLTAEDLTSTVTTRGNGNPSSVSATGVTGMALRVDFATDQVAWLLTGSGACSGFKAGCTQTARLLRTTDGGATWQALGRR